jgi:lysozyme
MPHHEINGVDVHAGKGDVDWEKVRAAGCEFALVKATEGQGFRDARFTKARWSAMKSAGVVRGAYHFARPSNGASDPVGEARDFLAAVKDVGGLKPGDLPLALDLEVTKLGPHDTFAWVKRFVAEVKKSIGRPPLLYTFPSFWQNQVGNAADNLDCPLWIANFGVSKPTIPRAWETHTIWQHSDHGSVTGVAGNVDLDRLNGNAHTLSKIVMH